MNHYQTNFCEQKTYHSLEIYKPWSSEIVYSKKSLCFLIFVFYCLFFFVTKKHSFGKQILFVLIHLFMHICKFSLTCRFFWISQQSEVAALRLEVYVTLPITQTRSQCLSHIPVRHLESKRACEVLVTRLPPAGSVLGEQVTVPTNPPSEQVLPARQTTSGRSLFTSKHINLCLATWYG